MPGWHTSHLHARRQAVSDPAPGVPTHSARPMRAPLRARRPDCGGANPTSCNPPSSCSTTSSPKAPRATRCTRPSQQLGCAASGACACGSTRTAVALHNTCTCMPGTRPSSCALSRVMRAKAGSVPWLRAANDTSTSGPSRRRPVTTLGHWLRMLVRIASCAAAACAAPPLATSAATCARTRTSASAACSSSRPASVSRVPPPPTPPTARPTSATPARLVRVSSACQAAL